MGELDWFRIVLIGVPTALCVKFFLNLVREKGLLNRVREEMKKRVSTYPLFYYAFHDGVAVLVRGEDYRAALRSYKSAHPAYMKMRLRVAPAFLFCQDMKNRPHEMIIGSWQDMHHLMNKAVLRMTPGLTQSDKKFLLSRSAFLGEVGRMTEVVSTIFIPFLSDKELKFPEQEKIFGERPRNLVEAEYELSR